MASKPVQELIEMFPGNIKKAMSEAGASSGDLWKVPRSAIRIIPGLNVRDPSDDPEYVNELAELIRENGYQQDQPLSGYVAKEGDQNVIYLTDGHHRLAAIDLLIAEGIEFGKLPVVVKPSGTSMEDVTFSLYISNTGKPLTPFQVGLLCKRLVGYGVDEKTIAQRFKFKAGKRYVDDLLSLVSAPKGVRDLVVSGRVSSTMAIQALRDHGSEAVEKLTSAVEIANAVGKTKATAKHMRKPAVKTDPTHVKVSIDDLKKWRDEWISLIDPANNTDCETPFDYYLHGDKKTSGKPVLAQPHTTQTLGMCMEE